MPKSLKIFRAIAPAVAISLLIAANPVRASTTDGQALALEHSQTLKSEAVLDEDNRSFYPTSLAFSPDARYIAVRSISERINIWDWKKNQKVVTLTLPKGANDSQTSAPLQFNPDGSLLAACHSSAEKNEVATIWDTVSWKVKQVIIDPGYGSGTSACAFTPDGKYFIRALTRPQSRIGDTLIVYDAKTWTTIANKRTNPFWIQTLAVNPDGNKIALIGFIAATTAAELSINDPEFRDLGSRATSRLVIVTTDTLKLQKYFPLSERVTPFSRIAWSPSGDAISYALGANFFGINIHDGSSIFHSPSQFTDSQASLQYTQSGNLVITQSAPNPKLQIWNRDHSKLLHDIEIDNSGVTTISRDRSHLAISTRGSVNILKLN